MSDLSAVPPPPDVTGPPQQPPNVCEFGVFGFGSMDALMNDGSMKRILNIQVGDALVMRFHFTEESLPVMREIWNAELKRPSPLLLPVDGPGGPHIIRP